MKKILYMSVVLGLSSLGLVGCNPNTTTNANRAVLNTNTNTAVMNSNMNSNMSSNTSNNVSGGDREFMEKAAQGGMAEVQLGEVAATRAQNEEVRAFAQKMVNDHSKANAQLKTLVAQKGAASPAGVNSEQQQGMEKLSKLSGAAFDKEYVRMMVEDHEKDVAEFQKQAGGGSDADLKQFATETLPTLKMHLQMIKEIQGKMK
jgi:putative membrane protein